jgi:hypothetical protein
MKRTKIKNYDNIVEQKPKQKWIKEGNNEWKLSWKAKPNSPVLKTNSD